MFAANSTALVLVPQAEPTGASASTLRFEMLLNRAAQTGTWFSGAQDDPETTRDAIQQAADFLHRHAHDIDVNYIGAAPGGTQRPLIFTAITIDLYSPNNSTLMLPLMLQTHSHVIDINLADDGGRTPLRVLGRLFTRNMQQDAMCDRALLLARAMAALPQLDVIAANAAGDSCLLNFLTPNATQATPKWRATSLAIYECLLSHPSCKINQTSRHKDRKTLLHWALTIPPESTINTQYLVDFVRLLVKHGADLEARCDPESRSATALMLAVVQQIPEMITLLINSGANVNALDGTGQPAVFLAMAAAKRTEAHSMLVLKTLLQDGLPFGMDVRESMFPPGLAPDIRAYVNQMIHEYIIHTREARGQLELHLIRDLANHVLEYSHGPNAFSVGAM